MLCYNIVEDMSKDHLKKLYLLTGASGHLGSTLLKLLLDQNERVRVLVLPNEERFIPKGVEIIIGNVLDKDSLVPFFQRDEEEEVILIHCAGIVTISSKPNPMVYKVNVEGTKNVLQMALDHNVDKAVYVSSVHALLEEEHGDTKETKHFEPEKIEDQYGSSKAMASKIALEYAQKGLNICIVHPSGIYGPGDIRHTNHSVTSIRLMALGYIPVSLKGGFDFVDVRDAAKGILLASEYGKPGETYILSGHYSEVSDLLRIINRICHRKTLNIEIPFGFLQAIAPLVEKGSSLLGIRRPLVTPYSIAILNSNGHFSHEKAAKELGYEPRSVEESLRDMVEEFKK